MRFICKYIKKTGEGELFRTIFADDILDATKRAEKYCRKGFMLVTVVQAI